MAKIQERIDAAEEQLTAYRDKMTELEKSLDTEETDTEAAMLAIAETAEEINKSVANRDVLLKARDSMTIQAKPVTEAVAPAVIKHAGTNGSMDPMERLVHVAAATMEAKLKSVPVDHILEDRFGGHEEVKAVNDFITRAAQNPAMSGVAGWAQELTRESYGSFMDMLKGTAVLPSLGLAMHDFNGYRNIKIPYRSGARQTPPNLAGAFRAEGDPIRVGAATTATITLTPKLMGIIGTFSLEMLERSFINFEEAIRRWMLDDTALELDTLFMSTTAATADAPAGILAGLATGDTAASGGNTAAQITADLRGRLQALTAHNMGRNPVWVMNPARAFGVQLALTAAGTPAFPSMANGTLMGIPVVTSTNVPAGDVLLIERSEVTYASNPPRFSGTETSVVHEEALQASVKPIVDSTAAPGVTANPVRSLWQTNSAGLRMTMELDWSPLRAGGVQHLSSCSW